MTDFQMSNPPIDSPVVPFAKPAVKPDAARPRVLAIANQKGGVGKTTTAINLGTALAATGEHVLIVDLDPQGNASTGLGIDNRNRSHSTSRALSSRSVRSVTAPIDCAVRSARSIAPVTRMSSAMFWLTARRR